MKSCIVYLIHRYILYDTKLYCIVLYHSILYHIIPHMLSFLCCPTLYGFCITGVCVYVSTYICTYLLISMCAQFVVCVVQDLLGLRRAYEGSAR